MPSLASTPIRLRLLNSFPARKSLVVIVATRAGGREDWSGEGSVRLVIGVVDLGFGSRLILDVNLWLDGAGSGCLVNLSCHSLLWSLKENVDGLLPATTSSSLEPSLDDLLDAVVGNHNLNWWGTSALGTRQPENVLVLEGNVLFPDDLALELVGILTAAR
jgi:hypothetical protein